MNYEPIKNVQLTNQVINKIKNHFKWSSFSSGQSKMSITASGGVHYTGKVELKRAISFEITRKNTYIMVSLFEYPKGVIYHPHVYYSQMSKLNKDQLESVLDGIYLELKKLLT